MKRNFVLTKYYKCANPKEIHTKGVVTEFTCIDKAMKELINDEIDYFKYEYNNQKVHVNHIIKKVGETYYEKVQEQR